VIEVGHCPQFYKKKYGLKNTVKNVPCYQQGKNKDINFE
jgi:hypothetical protein